MNSFKTVLLWILTGVVAGVGVASLVAPGLVTWNNTPGQGQALCNCVLVTRNTAESIIHAQLIGAAVGAVLFLLLALLLGRRRTPAKPATP